MKEQGKYQRSHFIFPFCSLKDSVTPLGKSQTPSVCFPHIPASTSSAPHWPSLHWPRNAPNSCSCILKRLASPLHLHKPCMSPLRSGPRPLWFSLFDLPLWTVVTATVMIPSLTTDYFFLPPSQPSGLGRPTYIFLEHPPRSSCLLPGSALGNAHTWLVFRWSNDKTSEIGTWHQKG